MSELFAIFPISSVVGLLAYMSPFLVVIVECSAAYFSDLGCKIEITQFFFIGKESHHINIIAAQVP